MDYIVPFHYVKTAHLSSYETINGYTFYVYKLPPDGKPEDEGDIRESLHIFDDPATITGFAVVDESIVKMLDDIDYFAGGDGAEEAVNDFRVAFLVKHAKEVTTF